MLKGSRLPVKQRINTAIERATRLPNGCLIFNGCKNPDGYGQIKFGGKWYKLHRIVYSLSRGQIPARLIVMHKCDTPSCIELGHLEIGTNADNTADCIAKGRKKPLPNHKGKKKVYLTKDYSRYRFV